MPTQWEIYFRGRISPVVVSAGTFLEAVEIARQTSEQIVSIKYLAY